MSALPLIAEAPTRQEHRRAHKGQPPALWAAHEEIRSLLGRPAKGMTARELAKVLQRPLHATVARWAALEEMRLIRNTGERREGAVLELVRAPAQLELNT